MISQTHHSQTRPFLWSRSEIVQSGYKYNYLHQPPTPPRQSDLSMYICYPHYVPPPSTFLDPPLAMVITRVVLGRTLANDHIVHPQTGSVQADILCGSQGREMCGNVSIKGQSFLNVVNLPPDSLAPFTSHCVLLSNCLSFPTHAHAHTHTHTHIHTHTHTNTQHAHPIPTPPHQHTHTQTHQTRTHKKTTEPTSPVTQPDAFFRL